MKTFSGLLDFCSNFYPARIAFQNISYPTSEHLYQALKFYDIFERVRISQLATPGMAKKAGQLAKWNNDFNKLEAMELAVRTKFQQNRDLSKRLLDTGDMELIEGNDWGDQFWGQSGGKGMNWLGKILMSVRDSIRLNGTSFNKLPCGCHCNGGCSDPYSACMWPCNEHVPF